MQDSNNLFPVFLKLENLRLLIVGGGYAGMEKLEAVLSNSPATAIILVAAQISDAIKEAARSFPNIVLIEKNYDNNDLTNIDIVITAINDPVVSKQIVQDAKSKKILVN